MRAFIKSRQTFATLRMLTVSDYDIVLDSIYDDISSLTVIGDATGSEGDWLICDGWIGVITAAAYEMGVTTLRCENILSAFTLPQTRVAGATYAGNFCAQLVAIMEDKYAAQADVMYDMPYLTPSTGATGTAAYPEPDYDMGLYTLKSYLAKARRERSIFCTWTIQGDELLCAINPKTVATRKIDFADRTYHLTSEDYSRTVVAKVTAVQMLEDYEVSHVDYYLHSDGSHSTTDADRVVGDWVTILTDAENEAAAVASEFLRSQYSHRIEFSTDKIYDFYDNAQIRLHDRVFNSYISCIRKTPAGLIYRTGEMRVGLTEKLKEMV